MQFNRLKRRELITLLGGAAAAGTSPLAALAQAFDKRPQRIAYLSGGSRAGTDKVVAAFLEGLRAHGYVEGPGLEIDYYWAEGHLERILTLAQEAVRSKPDLILASILQAAVVASDVTKTIPIVCPFLADPVRLGLIKSDARPGGNVTGLLLFVEGLPSKQLELVLDLIPGADKIGLVVNPDNANSLSHRAALRDVVAAKAIKIATIEVRTPENVDSIYVAATHMSPCGTLRQPIDAFVMFSVGEFPTWPASAAGWRRRECPGCVKTPKARPTGTAAASFYTSSVRLSRESGTAGKSRH